MPSPESRTIPEPKSKKRQTVEERLALHPEVQDRETLQDIAFQETVISKLVDVFQREMEEAGIPQDVADELALEFDAVEDRELLASMIALPSDLRPRIFQQFAEQQISAKEIVHQLAARVEKEGQRKDIGGRPLLGFHTSKGRVRKLPFTDPVSRERKMGWSVKGTEESDWSSVPQAYAARRYRNLHRDTPKNYLYVVRDRAENGFDRTNGWSRSNSFPVIAEMDLREIDDQVEHTTEDRLVTAE